MTGPAYPWLADDTWGLARINMTSRAGTQHQQCEITYASQGSSPSAQTDANTWFTIWHDVMMPQLIASSQLNHVDVILNRSGNLQEARSVQAPYNGLAATQGMPPNCAILLQKHTGVLGRHGRGHLYIPNGRQDVLDTDDPGLLTPTALTFWQSVATALFNAAVSAQLPMGLISRNQWVLPPLGYHYLGLTGIGVSPRIGTQRRRNRKAAHR
jgi:hypothetical protein